MINQSSPALEKLRILINQVLSAKTRPQIAQQKQQLRLFLQEYSSNSTIIQTISVFEQFLNYCTKYKKLERMLNALEDNTQFGVYYEKIVQEIMKKEIESKQKEDGGKWENQQAKPIRLFLTRMILESNTSMQNIIQLCKKDQIVCGRVLKFIIEYYEQRKVLVLCINLLKIRGQIPSSVLRCSLKILNLVLSSSQQIRNKIYPHLLPEILQIFNTKKAVTESIQFMAYYINFYNGGVENSSLIKVWIQNVCNYLKQMALTKQSKVNQKKYLLSKQQSSSITEFLIASYIFNNNQDNSDIIRNLLVSTGMDIMFILDLQYVGKVLVNLIFAKLIPTAQYVFFRQCLTNCSNYSFKNTKEAAKQEEIILWVLEWWVKLDVGTQNNIKKEFQLEELSCTSLTAKLQELPETIFLDFIKKTIQNQFQFEFDKNIVSSVCNLLCYLLFILSKRQNYKETVTQIIKMLLNLNESCQKQYRQFMVKNILRILCVHSKELLKDNSFLQEVLENKVFEHLYQTKDKVYYMVNAKLLSESFYEKIKQKLGSNEALECQSKNLQFLFEILLSHDRQYFQKNGMGWEWEGYINYIGSKVYGKQWIFDQKQLKNTKQNKMLPLVIEFEEDIQKIQSLLSNGEEKKSKK